MFDGLGDAYYFSNSCLWVYKDSRGENAHFPWLLVPEGKNLLGIKWQ